MKHFFTFFSAVSLLLFMITCAVWVRSQFARDDFLREATGRRTHIANSHGEFVFNWSVPVVRAGNDAPPKWTWFSRTPLHSDPKVPANPGVYSFERFAVWKECISRSDGSSYIDRGIILPWCSAALIFALAPAFWFRAYRLRRQRGEGDLRPKISEPHMTAEANENCSSKAVA